MIEAYKRYWKNYVNFKGRSTRADYWWPVLCNGVISFVLNNLVRIAAGDTANMVCSIILLLVTLLPSIAVAIRRLHDINKSGWYLFMGLIPLAGPIILLIYWCTGPVDEGNNYGEYAK